MRGSCYASELAAKVIGQYVDIIRSTVGKPALQYGFSMATLVHQYAGHRPPMTMVRLYQATQHLYQLEKALGHANVNVT